MHTERDDVNYVRDLRLAADNNGVTHWAYLMRGILFVCGQTRSYNTAYEPEHPGFPTCVVCISMVDQGKHIYQP